MNKRNRKRGERERGKRKILKKEKKQVSED